MSLLQDAQRCLANQFSKRHLRAFISVLNNDAVQKAVGAAEVQSAGDRKGPLNGRLIAVKDNICTKDFPTTSASSTLKSFTSPYDATVVSKLRAAGAIITGKTNLDEFGMGSHSTHSHFGAVFHDGRHEPLSAGGSSGGSAVAVATDQCWAALGTDTGGSVRLPAAYTGIVGFKPTYGLLSRWGVLAYANSLDTVGILSKNVQTTKQVFRVLNDCDSKDPTSLPAHLRKKSAEKRSLRIGIPTEYNIEELAPAVRQTWLNTLNTLTCETMKGNVKASLHPVSLPSTRRALSAYYVLAPAEASSNLAKYDGVRYGSRAPGIESPLFSRTRGEHFGEEVRRRILLGTYSLSAAAMDNYFIKAQKVRRLVQEDFNRVFHAANPLLEARRAHTSDEFDNGVDVLIHPTAPTLAPTLAQVEKQTALEMYTNDVFTVPASLAGLPAISIPVPCEDAQGNVTTCGVQVVGQFGHDEDVLSVAEMVELYMGSKLAELSN